MLTIPPETLHKAIATLGIEGIPASQVEADIASVAKDAMVARRLVVWIPEAFGIVLISHIGKINLPTTFSARAGDDKWHKFEFKVEPVFVESLRTATGMYHSGHRPTFGNIANWSSMLDVVNNMLNAGHSIEGATLSGPALIGIPAEVYGVRRDPLWQRVLRRPS